MGWVLWGGPTAGGLTLMALCSLPAGRCWQHRGDAVAGSRTLAARLSCPQGLSLSLPCSVGRDQHRSCVLAQPGDGTFQPSPMARWIFGGCQALPCPPWHKDVPSAVPCAPRRISAPGPASCRANSWHYQGQPPALNPQIPPQLSPCPSDREEVTLEDKPGLGNSFSIPPNIAQRSAPSCLFPLKSWGGGKIHPVRP